MNFFFCENCRTSLIVKDLDENQQHDNIYKFIMSKSQGCLIFPTQNLVHLISSLEQIVLNNIGKHSVRNELLINIMEDLVTSPPIILIGCQLHHTFLTGYITRMHFVCNQANKNSGYKSKTKKLGKISKL